MVEKLVNYLIEDLGKYNNYGENTDRTNEVCIKSIDI